ncbi:MAG: methionine--tRNA ligase [Candidatus Zambryskibacteria bacterium RIFCSPLOWO2_01_FULL_39_39]|uniref:Methionine--tRNA ligase n=1 Tax=Candidatus Zambryskibacteria bacterium RIFCSPLOWO2_01_FULL_39_39 TaxID=1802758 RepID=A0A1G2TWA3_9BACT|nr:MAG: Methionyl-tRNA synthetase [Parcubacteria group bacterium GW2011_GWA1_38_7]OHA86904.1 MAG: methionine--tRNA ligase [Candidatus Zambryskibacteria bacterium RIFCSPHIGHO2_01_FULL_39_63]OHA94469.1 MAG: methionine--tRNA ligase [Candidatus Zambryskibacteria bacterium RIFCSPHIGHO2_02_FULL_39_19]OHA99000.1 MAG: methionine--tRNA ligase [Candidatus Zambryskibacteria bacterium RIFCSPHIGHO2_12_FULL_39_21]OHB01577.1 MAG: methionine--tRNA ligase [Candidatus Zambryskibacteria bacterium RIFCSPLOWO2_01_F
MKTFYITTTLPYVNSDPHVGFAMEIIRADVIVRTKKLQGLEVFFNTGTDEHGSKIYQKALEIGKDPQEYVDEWAQKFKGLIDLLQISPDVHFVRTTDEHHIKAAQEFWKICDKNGFIYKKSYKIRYCVGCELEKTDSELIEGKCPIHPNLEVELIDEENYFFKFSSFQKQLLDLYKSRSNFVVPDFRLNEIRLFVERGLEDFSISRLKSKMPWGIPVPGDTDQVMYVWFDALVNYVSTLGWSEDQIQFEKFWTNGTPVQYCGKDNLRMQSAMWQAMLLAAGLPHSHQIVINGFFTGEGGIKMSKSLGNTVNPYDVVKEYGAEALRYYVCAEVSMFEDSPVSMDLIKQTYNAKLANGLGNLVSRIMKMASDNLSEPVKIPEWEDMSQYFSYLEKFEINKACDFIWKEIGGMDKYIQDNQPFKVVKEDKEKGKEMISSLVVRLYSVARMLNPILPETSAKIKSLIKENKVPEKPLFPRKD